MKKITNENAPCPCGSGKKYIRCCLIKTYLGVGKEELIKKRLIKEILSFFKRYYLNSLKEALKCFWFGLDPQKHLTKEMLQTAEINFHEWIVFDWAPEENDNILIDLFIEKTKKLNPQELKILAMMRESVLSLYEVQEVFPEMGLLLKDLLLGGEYLVRERLATRNLVKWDIFAARLLYLDGKYIMSGSIYYYPREIRSSIIKQLNKEFKEWKKYFPVDTMRDFLKWNSNLFNLYWCDYIINPPKMKVFTSTGEPFIIAKAIFKIKNKQEVIKALKKIECFNREAHKSFTWLDKEKEDGSALVLGNIKVHKSQLVLECCSQKRLEEGKKIIEENLSNLVIHKEDIIQDPMTVLESFKDMPIKEKEEKIPLEIEQELYTHFMDKYNKDWINQKIPALDGKTPLEAVKTKEGRKKVIEILKDIENKEEHKKRECRPFYDISWLWEALKIRRDEE